MTPPLCSAVVRPARAEWVRGTGSWLRAPESCFWLAVMEKSERTMRKPVRCSGPDTLPGTASGIPVAYEAKGRQYFVIASLPGGFRGGVASQASPDAPRGYIAFALPKR